MRAIPLLLMTAALVGCASAPPAPTRSAEGQAKLQQLTAGRVAGSPITCLPAYRTNDMTTIDDSTVVFKQGDRVYVNHLLGECYGLKGGFNTLVTRSGGAGLCRGDISEVTDVRTGTGMGSCALGDFVPYTRG
jgi:hypothetical protein